MTGLVVSLNPVGTATILVSETEIEMAVLDGALVDVDDEVEFIPWGEDYLVLGRVQGIGPRTYTPALTASVTNPSLGSGGDFTQDGRYWLLPGRMVKAEARLRFGSTGVGRGSGYYLVSLPFPADDSYHYIGTLPGVSSVIGNGVMRDANGGYATVTAYLFDANRVALMTTTGVLVASSVPWPWDPSDALTFTFHYRRAS